MLQAKRLMFVVYFVSAFNSNLTLIIQEAKLIWTTSRKLKKKDFK